MRRGALHPLACILALAVSCGPREPTGDGGSPSLTIPSSGWTLSVDGCLARAGGQVEILVELSPSSGSIPLDALEVLNLSVTSENGSDLTVSLPQDDTYDMSKPVLLDTTGLSMDEHIAFTVNTAVLIGGPTVTFSADQLEGLQGASKETPLGQISIIRVQQSDTTATIDILFTASGGDDISASLIGPAHATLSLGNSVLDSASIVIGPAGGVTGVATAEFTSLGNRNSSSVDLSLGPWRFSSVSPGSTQFSLANCI